MAEEITLREAAERIKAAECAAYTKLEEGFTAIEALADEILADLDFPEGFQSDAKRIATNMRANVRSLREYELNVARSKYQAPSFPLGAGAYDQIAPDPNYNPGITPLYGDNPITPVPGGPVNG
ncbi:hypothetical protein [Sphingomonas xinjiangensis]|uniref:Uncharacterized protein n=1 Tax=Sphingomonas xinjiangensis TaxID=643568 RepID=A0A840YP43_9SPHN|nr:hypothetical protein [Sphingomonas xinjiangensis]MBB5709452.1 hypothetical protein [Sphingomonas xinjiangensis]